MAGLGRLSLALRAPRQTRTTLDIYVVASRGAMHAVRAASGEAVPIGFRAMSAGGRARRRAHHAAVKEPAWTQIVI